MKTSKRFLTLLLAVCLCIGLVTVTASAAETTSGSWFSNITWSLADGTLTISGNGEMVGGDDGYAPWLEYKSEITRVVVEEGVTGIGSYAFYGCSGLTEVSLPDGLTYIGRDTFNGCTSLTSVVLPDGLTDLPYQCFRNCTSLTSIEIPDSVTSIKRYCFSGCTSLTSISIPDQVTCLDDCTFNGCTSLESIILPSGITSIGEYTFYNCPALTSVTLPDGLTTLGNGAFTGCTNLASISIPNSVTTIGGYCFSECESLTSIRIPAKVQYMEGNCFYRCTSLTKIEVASGNANYSSDAKGVLFNKDQTILIKAPAKLSGDYTIPSTVTEICEEAFYECTGLTGVTIPNGVTEIPYAAFEGCLNLASVTLPNKLETISYCAFEDCEKLTKVTFPATVKSILSSAFSNTGLTEVSISANVETLDSYAFQGCPNLKKITVAAGNPYYSSDASGVLFNKDKTELLTVPGAISGSYTVPNTVNGLGWGTFQNCTKLTSVTLPDGITIIQGGMFRGCTSLTSFTIPASVRYIERSAFMNSGLTQITIPATVETIDIGAFAACANLKKIDVAAGNPNYCSVGGVLFSKDKTELVQAPGGLSGTYAIPNTVTTIRSASFQGCVNLTGVTIPSSVTTLSDAFIGCTALTSVEIPGTITDMDACAFMNCTALKSAKLGSGVTHLAYHTFAGCTSLTDVDMPDTLTSIGWMAFKDCTDLDTVVIPENVTELGFNLFIGCTDLDNVVFTGDAPVISSSFTDTKTTAWYPNGNSTWTKSVRQDYGGDVTWKSYNVLGIKTQPKVQKVKAGATAKFTVKASGAALTYQWQYRTSAKGAWKNASAAGNKTATLKVPATVAKSGYQYRCKVTDAMGNTVTTKAVYLYVLGVKTQPVAKNVKAGVVAKFTVKASGHNKTFQWQYKNAAGKWVNATAPGAKTATLKVTAKVAFNGRLYRCVIKDSAGNQVITKAVKLTVFGIKTQPTNKTVAKGTTTKFSVIATGSGLKYQWQYKNAAGKWVNVTATGNKTATVKIAAKASFNGRQYRCKITDSLGRVIYTNAVKLTVK